MAEESMVEKAMGLRARASEHCFIANSMNFPVHHQPELSARVSVGG